MAAPKWRPEPLPTGCYSDVSKPFSDQDVVNLWPEYAEGEGTRSPVKLVQLPGLRPFADLGAGPHRAIRNVEGNLFVVADTHAYQVAVNGTVTQLGTIPGRGRVWISHNQNDSGAVRQVMFSDGPNGWIWDIAAQTWTQISDDAFHGARSLIYLNSRFLGIEQQRRYFANCAVADGLNWDSTETYQAESAPDRLVCLAAYAGEVYAFNERTLEIFQNTTNPDDIANHILFTRIGSPVPIGAGSPHGVCEVDSRLFFLGSNGAGYYMSGYNPVRITTPAIETAWQACELSKCFVFTYESRGHSVVYFTFPDGHTWGYDCLSSARAGRPIWHRRETIGLDRWRLNTLVEWNGGWYGGAYNSGILYQLDWDYAGLEGCDEINRYFIPGVLHDEGNRVTLHALRLECDTGYGTTTCESVEPAVPVIPDSTVGLFFSTGVASTSKTSQTGATWTNYTFPSTGDYCAASPSAVVVAKSTGELYYSTNRGQSFTASASTFTSCRGICYESTTGRFVAMRDDAGTLKLFYSHDQGVTWQAGATVGAVFGNDICAGLGCVVIATDSGIYVSDDGGSTVTHPIAGNWTAVGFNGTGFLIGANTGSAYEYSTAPKTTWTVMGGTTTHAPLTIVGDTGYFVIGMLEDGIYRTTNNGASFTHSLVDGSNRYYSAAINGSHIVMGSGGGGTAVQRVSVDAGLTFVTISPPIADNDICTVPLP
jgi:hypothetical protein